MRYFNFAIAQNKEHLPIMLKRQSVSAVYEYNLINFRKTTKYAKK